MWRSNALSVAISRATSIAFALTNRALVRFADGQVTVRYRHARTGESRRLTLPFDRFLTRFLQHVLPRSFPKVRGYGLLSPSRRPDLDHARALLEQHAAATAALAAPPARPPNDLPAVTPAACGLTCPVCTRGHLVFLHRLLRERSPP